MTAPACTTWRSRSSTTRWTRRRPGYATTCELTLNGDGSVTVRDDGRGIPTDIHAEEGVSAAEVVLTRLHAGGKFNQNSYKVSGGLHGVGAAVVNALSEWMEVRIWRNGLEHFIRFEHGDAVAPLRDRRPVRASPAAPRSPSSPAPAPSPRSSSNTRSWRRRLRELAFLNSGLRIVLRDERHAPPQETDFHYEGGLVAFVRVAGPRQDAGAARADHASPPQESQVGIRVEFALVLERQLPRDDAVLHQQHPAARRRHATWPASARR